MGFLVSGASEIGVCRQQTAHQSKYKKNGSTQGGTHGGYPRGSQGESSGRRGQLRGTVGTQGVPTGTNGTQGAPWSAMADHGGAFAPSPGCCFFCYQDQDKEGAWLSKLTEKDITPHTSSCFLPSLWAMPSQNVCKISLRTHLRRQRPEVAASRAIATKARSTEKSCHLCRTAFRGLRSVLNERGALHSSGEVAH